MEQWHFLHAMTLSFGNKTHFSNHLTMHADRLHTCSISAEQIDHVEYLTSLVV